MVCSMSIYVTLFLNSIKKHYTLVKKGLSTQDEAAVNTILPKLMDHGGKVSIMSNGRANAHILSNVIQGCRHIRQHFLLKKLTLSMFFF